MIPKKFKIEANKPDGTFIQLGGRDMDSITTIQSAMEANKYTNIKISRDMSNEMALVHEIMVTNKCGKTEAVKTFKNMYRVMQGKRTQIIRKEKSVHA